MALSLRATPPIPTPAWVRWCSELGVCHAGPVIAPPALLVAHQGGWDEILVVLVPIAIFAALLAVANRRASRAQSERDDTSPSDPG